jgi:acyl carrier protein
MKQKEEIMARLLKLANDTLAANLTEKDLSGIKRLDEVIGFDSMALLEWVAAIESEFQVMIPVERLKLNFLVDLQAVADFLCQNIIGQEAEAGHD